MDRHKRQNRKFFNNSEREHFLEKSNYVCSHCGKPLDVHTMTVEHALPISKGGENDDRNLVALCSECNPLKSNKVILRSIPNYFKYLRKEDLILLLKYADEYNRGMEWFSWDNWFEEDVFVGTPEGIPKGMDWIKHEDRLKATAKTVVRKARYTDLQDILDFYVRKGKNYSFMKRELYLNFLLGSVYAIYNASSEVVGSFSVGLFRMTDYYSPCITDILYSKKYYLAMKYVLSLLLNNIKRKSPGLVDTITISIFYKEDVCDILNNVLECKPNPLPDKYFIDEVQGEIQVFWGAISKISSTKLSGEASLRKYLKATEKGYRRLINKRNEEVRNFVSNDVYEKVKKYM